jgi:hypothetical protein
VLFDPFEEQFDLPALFVYMCDGERRKDEVVGQKLQSLAGFGIAIDDAAQLLWVRRGRLERGKNRRLIRVHARASVYRVGVRRSSRMLFLLRVTKKAEPSVNW